MQFHRADIELNSKYQSKEQQAADRSTPSQAKPEYPSAEKSTKPTPTLKREVDKKHPYCNAIGVENFTCNICTWQKRKHFTYASY